MAPAIGKILKAIYNVKDVGNENDRNRNIF